MSKFNKILLTALLCLSPVICSANQDNDNCPTKFASPNKWQSVWPVMPPQVTPGDQGFCAPIGAFLIKTTGGSLTKAADVSSWYTNQWVTENGLTGYYATVVYVQLSVEGVPQVAFTVHVNNIINRGKPCRNSPDDGVLPNQTTLMMNPNLDMDIVRDENGIITVEDNFFYTPVNPETGLIDSIRDMRLVDFSSTILPSSVFELYYDRVANLSTDCSVYTASQARKLPNLNDDLSRVWKLENGITMTGAQLKKALGY